MHQRFIFVVLIGIFVSACGQNNDSATQTSAPQPDNALTAPSDQTSTPPAVEPEEPVENALSTPSVEDEPSTATIQQAMSESETPVAEPAREAASDTATVMVAGLLSREDGLALAQRSGCLACHSIEKRVVGPAWQDIAARYKGNGDARAELMTKVSEGGKGNWTEETGGTPMPPYGSRVAAADIEKLVDFILALE